MQRTHDKNKNTFARELRNNMTKEEKHLWYDYLKPYHQQFHVVFLRQKIVGDYILDFYCPKAKLAIELDGSQHYQEEAVIYDRQRTEFLNQLGISVLRYSNRDIHTRFEEVCNDIDCHVIARIDALQE